MKLLPNGWTEAPIRTLMQPLPDGKLVHQGWSPQCESGPASSDSDWGALKTTAIQDGAYLPEHNKRLPDSLEAKERLEVLPGDLLMTCAGPRVRCGVACLVRATPPRRFISGKMYRFRSNEAVIDPRLLEAFLRTPGTKAQIDAMKTGISESGMNITHEKFSQLVVPVAPRSEQKRIADKLDTVLTRVDAVNTRLARVAPLLKRFRQSVLAAATSGRLTEDWRAGRTPDWDQPLFADVVVESSTGLVRSASEQFPMQEGLVPYLKMNSVGEIWGYECVDLPSVHCSAAEFKRYELRQGDWLFNTRNSEELVGKSCVWSGPAGVVFNNNLLRVRFRADINPKWVEIFFRSPTGRDLLAAVKSATTSVAAIYQRSLMGIPMLRPPEVEQAEIVRRVETLFAFADRLEARLQTAQTAADRLTPSLLAKAFRGELVPQDPNDEPACELLRRLQQEAPKTVKKRERKSAS